MLKEDFNSTPKIKMNWKETFRVIPSKFPPIDFFEKLVSPDLMEELFYVENLTNDRLREEVGDISLVAPEDRVCGIGASWVMAPFTHISRDRPSRFSDGSFGIYYAANSLLTALKEKSYHSEQFLLSTMEPPGVVTMRVYQSKPIRKELNDIREKSYQALHHATDYSLSQSFGLKMKEANAWGIIYNSVRDVGGECAAILRPIAIPLPVNQTKHFDFVWDGKKICQYYELGLLHEF